MLAEGGRRAAQRAREAPLLTRDRRLTGVPGLMARVEMAGEGLERRGL